MTAHLARRVRGAALLLALILPAACANQLAQRQARLAPLVGRPVSDLIRQLGVPNRTFTTGGVEYLAYEEKRIEVVPGLWGGPFWYGGWGWNSVPPQVVQWQCETTFAVVGGVVHSFTFHGNACG
jgi:hypothetical protein